MANMSDIFKLNARLVETKLDRFVRETTVVLNA